MLIGFWISIFVFFWTAYYYITNGRLTRHLGFFHFLLYFLSIYLGAISVYEDGGSTDLRYLISVLLYPLLALFGMLTASLLKRKAAYPDVEFRYEPRDNRLVVRAFVFFLIFFGVYLYSLGSNIPLFALFSGGDSYTGRLTRYLATKGYEGEGLAGLHLFFWLPRILIDYYVLFLFVFYFFYFLTYRKNRLQFLGLVGFLFLVVLLANEKYPAMKLFAFAGLCYFNYKNTRVKFSSILLAFSIFLAGIFILGIVYGVVSGSYIGGVDNQIFTTFKFGWEMFVTRGLFGQNTALYQTYEIVPSLYDFFFGRTLSNPRHVFFYDSVPLPYVVYDSYNAIDPEIQGGDPTVFFGEVYANFGLMLSFLSMFLFGFVIQYLNGVLAEDIERFRKPFYLAFLYMVMAYIGDFAISFSTIYFDERFWFFIFIYFIQKTLDQKDERRQFAAA